MAAEALLTVVLDRLATIALDKVGEEFRLVTGVEKEVKSLTRNLEAIRAVLEDAEQRQVTEATVRRWLSELTEVSFEMDDVLDEWITEVLKRQMEKQEQEGETALVVATKKKVRFPCLSSCFCVGQVNQLMLRRDIAVRIKELNERVASIDKEKQSFTFQNTSRVPELPQRQKTTSLPNVKTFGRDSEKNLIVSKLLGEGSQEKECPLIIPIVGMGGMGKTTLAQLVYNDDNVKSHFDKRIWVCVSDPFDEVKIAQAIIEEFNEDNISKDSIVLQTLTQCIHRLIEGKRFLLVLDDVWSPKLSQWEELIKPLRDGAMGSRVLVTTRKEETVVLMKAITQTISLKELGESCCLSLFYYNADINESSVSTEFNDIGLEIVKRCNGLPLAAKTLGSLMCNKKNIHEWRALLKSKTWELKEIQHDVFRPLLLSYYDLSPAIKCCLLYCVTFPKDFVYNKNKLVELWMSQDYLNARGNKEKMIVGQNYFDDLVMRSFFQDVKEDNENETIRCKIHDIVHDFLQYLTDNECLILDLELAGSERNQVPNEKIHHLTLLNASKSESLAQFLLSYKKLRTLTVIDPSQNSIGSIVQLKCLRTLILRRFPHWRIGLREIPETLGGLIHLRYLDLSDNAFKELPDTMSNLYNLQTLRLVSCHLLNRIDVGRLINLRHLYVNKCSERLLIKGIEKLKHMQTLDWFPVPGGGEGNKLLHLKDLNQLQGSLEIQIRGDEHPSFMAENNNAVIMVNKAHLLKLKLEFYFPSDDEEKYREIMNGLKPHPGLESLSVYGYQGGAYFQWLSALHRLRVLTLDYFPKCKILPPLGQMRSLESLCIQRLDRVEKVGVEFLGILEGQTSSSSMLVSFPKLKQLSIKNMWIWEEWEEVEENSESITIMPCLSHLTIHWCKPLKALPDFLWKTPLQKLQISDSPILENLYREEIGEQWPKISHIPSIRFEHDWGCCIS